MKRTSKNPEMMIRGRPKEETIAVMVPICAFSRSVGQRAGGMVFISSLNLDGLL